MRLDPTQGETAVDLLNQMTEAELADLLYECGEERHRAPDRPGDRPAAPARHDRRPRRRRAGGRAAGRLAAAAPRGDAHVSGRAHGSERRAGRSPAGDGSRPPAAGPRGATRRDCVSLGRRPHREADVPETRGRGIHRARAVAPAARGRRGAGQSPRPERQAARAGAASVNIHQRLHREQDPRARRAFIAVASRLRRPGGRRPRRGRPARAAGAPGLPARPPAPRAAADRDGSIRQLEVEIATLQSPARVEQRARQLGLVAPARQQVRLAREYVPAGTGLAAAHRSRVAVAPDGEARIPIR